MNAVSEAVGDEGHVEDVSPEAVVRKFAHRAVVSMSEKVLKPKWSALRGRPIPLPGLKLHVPEPVASSAQAAQVSPAPSNRSTMLGSVLGIPQQQYPSPVWP